jgi:hypothetical protein
LEIKDYNEMINLNQKKVISSKLIDGLTTEAYLIFEGLQKESGVTIEEFVPILKLTLLSLSNTVEVLLGDTNE